MRPFPPTDPFVLSLGLTPALQRTLIFDHFAVGEVNRAREVILSAAGKGVNVGMALAAFGRAARVTGFNGGSSGRVVEADARRRGAWPMFTRIDGPTRVCDTVVDRAKGQVTELVEEAPAILASDLARYQRTALSLARRCLALAISGTVPPALARQAIYVPFAELAARRKIPWVIDSHRDDLLSVLRCRPLVAKMNRHELGVTFGRRCTTERTVVGLMRRILAAGAQQVFITDGARPAWLLEASGAVWRLRPPALEQVVNPIGSGDCVTAAMLSGLLDGRPLPAAARLGLACGSANAATRVPADFDMRLVKRLFQHTTAERLS